MTFTAQGQLTGKLHVLIRKIKRGEIKLEDFFEKGLEELRESIASHDGRIIDNVDFHPLDARFGEVLKYVKENYPDFDTSDYEKGHLKLFEGCSEEMDKRANFEKIIRTRYEYYSPGPTTASLSLMLERGGVKPLA